MPQFKFEHPVATQPRPAATNDNLAKLSTHGSKFEHILAPHDWAALPQAVRARFSKNPNAPESQLYRGYVVYTRRNFIGGVLAQTLRLIGAPLPLDKDNVDATAIVTVTPDPKSKGQIWTRQYGRAKGFPQIIQSAKQFSGPTGLEEYIGYGIGMALNLRVKNSVLLFESAHYFLKIGEFKLRLPKWMAPGDLMVSHADHGGGWFEFGLKLTHRIFGQLLNQSIMFQDMESL